MNNRYSVVPRRFWKKKAGFSGPEKVSIHGALPSPREAYEIEENGYSIYDSKNNRYSNYFFGKIGIQTEDEANDIIYRLTNNNSVL
jgi:hypothetical protein